MPDACRGTCAGVDRSHARPTPEASTAHWVSLTQAALAALVVETGCDVLIAINNAENLARAVAEQAQSVLADARDVFLVPNTHWLLVGTPDFYTRVIEPSRQLGGIMGPPLHLEPLRSDEVEAIIARRYTELRIPNTPFVAPISVETAGALARIFIGDLRELLNTFEMIVLELYGLGPGRVSLSDAMHIASRKHRELLATRMEKAAWAHLKTVVVGGRDRGFVVQRFREADAVRLLAPMSQPTVNAHKRTWLEDGLVRSDGRSAGSEWLSVSGHALLAMLPEAEAMGLHPEVVTSGRDLSVDPLPELPAQLPVTLAKRGRKKKR